MKKKYYSVQLNNARYMCFDNEVFDGCLKINLNNGADPLYEPVFVIAEKYDDGFIDVISGKKIKINESIASRGNFKVNDNNLEIKIVNGKEEYLSLLDSVSEDVLSSYDEEARHILNYFNPELSCFSSEELSSREVVTRLKKLDDSEVISNYMKELDNIEFGSISKEKAKIYLDARRKNLINEDSSDEVNAEKYIKVFRSRYEKLR